MPRTMEGLLDLAALRAGALPAASRRFALFSLFDWLTVARAGAGETLSVIVRNQSLAEGGAAVAAMAGSRSKVPARAAALVNGTTSHALDYDDTHFAHIGHLSVGIYPAALAAGEEVGAGAGEVRDAFLIGAEGACRLGLVLGRGHYQRGFHQTATAGAFGATLAAGRLYGLSRTALRHALSLVATRASGLQAQFGTMGKPFNAGMAASNGVEAALLAGRGFTSCDDGIEGAHGFVETHADHPDHDGPWANPPPGHFVFDAVSYKLHACCHGTHAMIEALQLAMRSHGVSAGRVAHVVVKTHPRWLRVCDIKAPRSGLEVKFSYVLLAAMVLAGHNTASEKAYVDALCSDAALGALAARVEVSGDERLADTAASVTITTTDGATVAVAHDLAAPLAPELLEQRLRAKSEGLLGAAMAGRLWQAMQDLDRLAAADLGRLLSEN